MNDDASAAPEADPRFPSGPWTGFFLQKEIPGKHRMELDLRFSEGVLTGEGRDWVGEFLFRGRYDTGDGSCHWTKSYVGRHEVFYRGFNEGKGIWGTWELTVVQHGITMQGGFHIWPEGMPDPTGDRLAEAADLPVFADDGEAEEPDAVEVNDTVIVP